MWVYKPLKNCMESCYWHLIEKRFCFDESIALYEEPEKEEKNNNMFDNLAFYDSVSVIAGRSIVTIEPIPEKSADKESVVITEQPTAKRLTWLEKLEEEARNANLSKSVPNVFENTSNELEKIVEEPIKKIPSINIPHEDPEKEIDKEILVSVKNLSTNDIPETVKEKPLSETTSKSTGELLSPEIEKRRKSLHERRLSKSLYLKLDLHKELPIIRQNSMPKFYLDTPDESQIDSILCRNNGTCLRSPMSSCSNFNYDLYSVVQMEKERQSQNVCNPVPIHREGSRLNLIKEKMKLRKSKSTVSSSSIPHSNYI